MRLLIFWCTCLVGLATLSALADSDTAQAEAEAIPIDTNVDLVFVGFRHGNRNPGTFLPDDPNPRKWGFEGSTMLTNIGKQQAFFFGKMMRERYSFLLSSQFDPDELTATSSSADRCQMTTQSFLTGLYPPEGWSVWEPEIEWQPISIAINDALLRMYNQMDCQPQLDAWKPVNAGETPEGAAMLSENDELINFVCNKTGWKKKLDSMADTADNLEGLQVRNLKLPEWVKTNPFNKNLLHDINKFAEATQILCAKYKPCRKFMAGYWLNTMVNEMKKKRDGKSKKKMFVYGSHNEIVTSLLWSMGLKPEGVYFNGAAIIEYRDKPAPAVRVIYSAPTEDDPEDRESKIERLPFCGDDWCPLDTFIEGVKDHLIEDWQHECKLPVCSCDANAQGNKRCRQTADCGTNQECVQKGNVGECLCKFGQQCEH